MTRRTVARRTGTGRSQAYGVRVTLVVAALLISVALGSAASAQNTCNSGKLKCMAKKAQCILKVHAKGIKKGEAPDAE